MFKSKHSGWTWDLKRTPYGGGGGGFISAITDPISQALGTSGGGGGLLGAVAKIDPGPAIGKTLASVDPGPMIGKQLAGLDKFVGNEIPGGWATVGALGAGGLGMVFAPEIAAALESAGLSTEASTLTPQMVNFANASADPIGAVNAIAGMSPTEFATAKSLVDAGMTIPELNAAVSTSGGISSFSPEMIGYINSTSDPIGTLSSLANANISPSEFTSLTKAATDAGLSNSSLTPQMLEFASNSPDPIGTFNAIHGMTPEEFASVSKVIGGAPQAAGLTAGEDLASLMKSYPNLSSQQLQDIMSINYGTDPLLSADAANLAANGYDANTINQVLGYSYNPTELTGTGIQSVAADSAAGLNAKDVLQNLSRAKQLASLLGGVGNTLKAAKLPTQQQWTKQATQNLTAAAPVQQFGGLYEMNKNPFTFQNPIANALAGGNKQPGVFDVSGTPGTTLNTTQQNQIYSSLLRS